MISEVIDEKFFSSGQEIRAPGFGVLKSEETVSLLDFIGVMSKVFNNFNGRLIGGLEAKIDRFSL